MLRFSLHRCSGMFTSLKLNIPGVNEMNMMEPCGSTNHAIILPLEGINPIGLRRNLNKCGGVVRYSAVCVGCPDLLSIAMHYIARSTTQSYDSSEVIITSPNTDSFPICFWHRIDCISVNHGNLPLFALLP